MSSAPQLRWSLLLCLLSLLAGPALASAQDSTRTNGGSSLFPPRLSKGGVVYLPKLYWSSQTSFAVGGQLLRPFRFPGANPGQQDSDVRLKGRITAKGQSALELRSNLFFGDCRWYSTVKLRYDSLPQRFWGLGPDTPSSDEEEYRPQHLLAYAELFRCVGHQLKLGVRAEIEEVKYLDTERAGLLETMAYRGTDEGNAVGMGVVFDWDRRDRRYSPTAGTWLQGFALWFDEEFGSEYDFNQYHLDLRHYQQLREGHVLATQVFLYAARGGAPIWRYAALGGREHTRGYRKGRYLDRVLLAFQSEYRFPLYRRLEGVVFAGLGHVAPIWDSLQLEAMRPTVGGGLRYRVKRREDVKIRVDLAVGEHSLRAYWALDHAF